MSTDRPDDQITVITGMLPGEQASDYCPTCGYWLGAIHHTNGQPCPPTTASEETDRA